MQSIQNIAEVQAAYSGRETANEYVSQRFETELNRLLHDRQVQILQQWLDRSSGGAVLEIAPGPGRLTKDLRFQGAFIALEFNEGMIEAGRTNCPAPVQWVRGSGFHLPFAGCFHMVFSFRFLRHFQIENRQKLYAEIRRVLRPNGYFIFDAVNERVSRPLRNAHPGEYPIFDDLFSREKLQAELKEAGLPVIEMAPVLKLYSWQWKSQVVLGPRAGWLNRLVIRGLEKLPRKDGLEWVVTCRRA